MPERPVEADVRVWQGVRNKMTNDERRMFVIRHFPTSVAALTPRMPTLQSPVFLGNFRRFLVDEAIRNVRELSQLLRPIILDDFGLDASLRWLTERFTQRTGIETGYHSNFHGRLADETETHLFRIAQEALTNVARHSGATRIEIRLEVQDGDARLSIGDNGKGLRDGGGAGERGLGMTGMRARARSAGGELNLRSLPGQGVSVDVRVPARAVTHEQEDSHPARR